MPTTPKPKTKSRKSTAPDLVAITVVTKVEKGYHPGSILVTSSQLQFKNGVLDKVDLERRYAVDMP
jgi:hypothetical protein